MTCPETCDDVAVSRSPRSEFGFHHQASGLVPTKLPAPVVDQSKASDPTGSGGAQPHVSDDVRARHIGDGRLSEDGVVDGGSEVHCGSGGK